MQWTSISVSKLNFFELPQTDHYSHLVGAPSLGLVVHICVSHLQECGRALSVAKLHCPETVLIQISPGSEPLCWIILLITKLLCDHPYHLPPSVRPSFRFPLCGVSLNTRVTLQCNVNASRVTKVSRVSERSSHKTHSSQNCHMTKGISNQHPWKVLIIRLPQSFF